MKNYRQTVGEIGEQLAIQYLEENGYQVIKHHYTTHWGELDIIAQKESTLHLIEVKTRIGDSKGKPYEAITYFKLRALKRAAQQFLLSHNYSTYKLSILAISIILYPDKTLKSLQLFAVPV